METQFGKKKCLLFWKRAFPNVCKTGISDFVRYKEKDVIALNPECEECPLLIQCGTGCRSSALILGGNLFGKDTAVCQLWLDGYKDSFEKLLRG
jgi:radical SAM protein with 4Fe4S-binding SPASM domain